MKTINLSEMKFSIEATPLSAVLLNDITSKIKKSTDETLELEEIQEHSPLSEKVIGFFNTIVNSNTKVVAEIPSLEYAEELWKIIFEQYKYIPDYLKDKNKKELKRSIDEVLVKTIEENYELFIKWMKWMKILSKKWSLYLKIWNYYKNLRVDDYNWENIKIWAWNLVSNDEMYCIWDSEKDREMYVLEIMLGNRMSIRPNVWELLGKFI